MIRSTMVASRSQIVYIGRMDDKQKPAPKEPPPEAKPPPPPLKVVALRLRYRVEDTNPGD